MTYGFYSLGAAQKISSHSGASAGWQMQGDATQAMWFIAEERQQNVKLFLRTGRDD
jgi:hypothetical protein